MAQRVRCPGCGEAYQLPDEFRESLAGKRVECAKCGQPFAAGGDEAGRIRKLLAGPGEVVPIDLSPYREDPSEIGAWAAPASALGGAGAEEEAEGEAAVVTAAPPPPRVASPPAARRSPVTAPAGAAAQPLTAAELGDETIPDRPVVRRASEERMRLGHAVFLVGLAGNIAGRTFKIERSRTLIGRTVGEVVLGDGKASRTHAQLDVTENGQVLLRDLASTNGTTVNGVPITVARLESGSVVGIGDCRLRLVIKA